MPNADCRLLTRAMQGGPEECGDAGYILKTETFCLVALIDALGHGAEAHQVAEAGVTYLTEQGDAPLVDLLAGMHERLKGGRGAVAALCRLDFASGELRFAGVGNISCRIFKLEDPQRLVSRDGVNGYMTPTPRETITRMTLRDALILYSDGITDHFDPLDCPSLLRGDAAAIADELFAKFRKTNDDASCLVMRYVR